MELKRVETWVWCDSGDVKSQWQWERIGNASRDAGMACGSPGRRGRAAQGWRSGGNRTE